MSHSERSSIIYAARLCW